jgi:hypothetical protein
VGTVVIVSELAHNPGLSIERNFGRVAERVRRWVPADCEPVWLEHWPARALAVWVLHDAVAPSTHLRRPVSGAWSRSPLSPQALEQLLKHSAAAD